MKNKNQNLQNPWGIWMNIFPWQMTSHYLKVANYV